MNRRYFLMTSAAAGAARANALTSANNTVRIGIAGTRMRGIIHVRSFANLPNVEVVALCDVDPSVLKEGVTALEEMGKRRPAAYVDFRRMLEDKSIDAVSIATPNHWHTLQTIWACQAGKDVFVEKPCSHNIFESQQIVAAAKKYGRMVQHGNQARSSPAVQEAFQKLKEGVIGDVYMTRGLCYRLRPSIGRTPVEDVPAGVDYDLWTGPAPRREFTRNRFHYNWHWFWDFGNGDLGNQGIHEIDLCRAALGLTYPTRISAMGGKFMFDDDQETPNVLTVCYEFDNNGREQFMEFSVRHWITNDEALLQANPENNAIHGGGTSYDSGDYHPPAPPRPPAAVPAQRTEVRNLVGNIYYGPNGYLVIRGYDQYYTRLGRRQEPGPHAKSRGAHWANFIQAVRSRKESELNSPLAEGAMSCVALHLGNISYRLGRTLTFDRKTMTCVGDEEANRMFTRDYRKPFVVPERV